MASLWNPKVLLVGDSILRHIRHTQLEVVCKPGAHCDRITRLLQRDKGEYEVYPIIILHVGTNDLHKGMVHFMDVYEELVLFMKVNYPQCSVFFSNILPRPKDLHNPLYEMVTQANTFIEECVHHYEAGKVIYTHRAFQQNEQPIISYYSDGLHVNTPPGVQTFTHTIMSYLGQWCRANNTNIASLQFLTI